MAVAVGRPSVSAGASLPSPAAPPALGGPRFQAGAGGKFWAPGRGLRTVVTVDVCMNVGARLGLRGRRGAQRLYYYVMQQCIALWRPDSRDVGEKGPLSSFPF